MNLVNLRPLSVTLGFTLLILLLPVNAQAQRAAAGPPDWPCVQRLIPELAWGTLWTGPSPDELEQEWWEDEQVGRTVRLATTMTISEEQALEHIQEFIAVSNPDEQRLTLLFSGIFEQINNERSRTIEKIRSAARAQVARLEQVSELVDDLEAARDSTSVEQEEAARLEEELHWERRTFTMRQQALPALCEKPYLLEERLSRMVRVIDAAM
tara:strand:+ start:36746 stop:37378 length:633 start_codon:yes stop_codon:yes gene_type:complete